MLSVNAVNDFFYMKLIFSTREPPKHSNKALILLQLEFNCVEHNLIPGKWIVKYEHVWTTGFYAFFVVL